MSNEKKLSEILWPEDFPKVMHFIDLNNMDAKPWEILRAHRDYEAAKTREDRPAALRLVRSFLETKENQAQLRTLKAKYQDAVIVPVRAEEAMGKNRIPEELAEYLAKRTGIEIDTTIVQKNKVHRTGSGEWHRFAFRPEFEGEVKSGRRYILVDDVFSQGGSLNELRVYIERRGGKAVQTIAMALGGHGDSIAPDAEGTKKLLDKFGKDKIDSFMEDIGLYEGHSNCLTGPETCSLRRAERLDAARDRILEARREGRARMGVEGPGRCGASAVSSGAQSESDAEDPPYHRHARRRGRGRGI